MFTKKRWHEGKGNFGEDSFGGFFENIGEIIGMGKKKRSFT